MLIIGLVAPARHGKTTVASTLLREARALGLKAETFEASSYILEDAIHRKEVENKLREELSKEEIKKLVDIGLERRLEDPYYWLKRMKADLAAQNPDVAIFPSIRFHNEAQMVKDIGGKLVRVTSYISDGRTYVSPDRDPNHVSETEQFDIKADYFLVTKRGESDLLKRLAATLFKYLHGAN